MSKGLTNFVADVEERRRRLNLAYNDIVTRALARDAAVFFGSGTGADEELDAALGLEDVEKRFNLLLRAPRGSAAFHGLRGMRVKEIKAWLATHVPGCEDRVFDLMAPLWAPDYIWSPAPRNEALHKTCTAAFPWHKIKIVGTEVVTPINFQLEEQIGGDYLEVLYSGRELGTTIYQRISDPQYGLPGAENAYLRELLWQRFDDLATLVCDLVRREMDDPRFDPRPMLRFWYERNPILGFARGDKGYRIRVLCAS